MQNISRMKITEQLQFSTRTETNQEETKAREKLDHKGRGVSLLTVSWSKYKQTHAGLLV